MYLKGAAFTLACGLASTSALAADIASTSLCGDAYVLALAPERISALSWQSGDPLARTPDEMRALPQVWDVPEVVAGSPASHFVFGAGEGYKHAALYAASGKRSFNLAWTEDFEGVKTNLAGLGTFLGEAERSQSAINDIDARLAALSERAARRGSAPKVLYMSRSGGTAGSGTYVDAAIKAAGGVNAVETQGWTTPDIEYLITLDPDLIVTSFFQDGYESVQAKGVRHAVLGRFMDARPQVDIPGSLWPCAGPDMINAAELIAGGLDGLP